MSDFYPLRFVDDFRDKPWGSSRLHSVLGKDVAPDRPVGESWEVWGGSVVADGRWAGQTLDEVVAEHWLPVMGRQLAGLAPHTFPLLFKFLDANEWLSVQVHPDDSYASQYEGVPYGKTEAWYIIHADPGAEIIYGWNQPLTRDAVSQAVLNDSIKQLLRFSVVSPGDVVPVPAGTVHALGSGIVLAEIQQSSDVTYRLYDWGRVGLDGKPRELHVTQSLDTLDYSAADRQFLNADSVPADGAARRLALCSYFTMDLLDVDGELTLELDGERFVILAALRGDCTIGHAGGSVPLPLGSSVLLPASLGTTTLAAPHGARLLALTVPRPDEIAAIGDPQRTF